MMRSMFSGVSGLKVHQTKMDVIGNNISNVNTVGYKATSMHFQDSFSQVMRSAGSPQGGLGGTNPQQIGLGAGISGMDVDHSKGSTQRTDRPLDLMIDGNGYFVITNDPTFENRFFTRAGNFTTDTNGYIVTPNGYKLLGTDMQPLRVDKSKTKAATTTTRIDISGNVNLKDDIDPATNIAYTSSVDVFDTLGNYHTLTINFGQKLEFDDNAGDKGFLRNITIENKNIKPAGKLGDLGLANLVTPTPNANAMYAKFDEKGSFVGLVSGNGMNIDNTKHVVRSATALTEAKLNLVVPGAEDVNITLFDTTKDPKVNAFSSLTQYPKEGNVRSKNLDGNTSGLMESFNVSSSGEIVGIFTNGERQVLGQLALADFDNNVGLQKAGSNMFISSTNSGAPKYGKPGTSSFGSIAPGALEMSNVDLSNQFTDLITTQRGFQSNSRIITASDEMLQELVNLKR